MAGGMQILKKPVIIATTALTTIITIAIADLICIKTAAAAAPPDIIGFCKIFSAAATLES